MTRSPRRCACLLLAMLGGCSLWPASPRSRTDQATLAACRSYASQVYDRQNRGTIYSINQSGLPFSNSYLAENQTATLAAQYANENLIDDCIRNTGTQINRNNPQSAVPIQPPPTPSR
jgi:hypothetical protein